MPTETRKKILQDTHLLTQFVHTVSKAPDTPWLIQWIAQDASRMVLCQAATNNGETESIEFEHQLGAVCRSCGIQVQRLVDMLNPVARSLGLITAQDQCNFYDILDVDSTAVADEIHRAFRRKARKLHPDANPDNSANTDPFIELQHAYEALKDPNLRQHYDASCRNLESWNESKINEAPGIRSPWKKIVFQLALLMVFLIGLVLIIDNLFQEKSLTEDYYSRNSNSESSRSIGKSKLKNGDETQRQASIIIPPDGQLAEMEIPDTNSTQSIDRSGEKDFPQTQSASLKNKRADKKMSTGPSPVNKKSQADIIEEENGSSKHDSRSVSAASPPDSHPSSKSTTENTLENSLAYLDTLVKKGQKQREDAKKLNEITTELNALMLSKSESSAGKKSSKKTDPPLSSPAKSVSMNETATTVKTGTPQPDNGSNKTKANPAIKNNPVDGNKDLNDQTLSDQAQQIISSSASKPQPNPAIAANFTLETLQSFIDRYCNTYASRKLDRLRQFFTSDAQENGKKLKSQLPQYRKTFNRIDQIDYRIKLKKYAIELDSGSVQLQGNFWLKWRDIKGDKHKSSNGSINMELTHSEQKGLLIKELHYSFK
jgi:curved DNA-binding protein CbpA